MPKLNILHEVLGSEPACCRSMSLIQALLCKASLSDLFLFFKIWKIFGARFWSHALLQKDVLLPSPTVINVAAANRSLPVVSHGVSELVSGLLSPSHSFHSHLRRSALENFLRCRMPRPPDSVGPMERGQFTLHPP